MARSAQGKVFCKGSVGYICRDSTIYIDKEDKYYWWADFEIARAVYLHIKKCFNCSKVHDINIKDLVI